jgi:hypothetical protein
MKGNFLRIPYTSIHPYPDTKKLSALPSLLFAVVRRDFALFMSRMSNYCGVYDCRPSLTSSDDVHSPHPDDAQSEHPSQANISIMIVFKLKKADANGFLTPFYILCSRWTL